MLRFALVLSLAACGSKPHNAPDPDGAVGDAATSPDDSSAPPVDTAAPADAFVPPVDAFPAVLDLRIDCHNDCVLVANPAAIAVAAGTAFEVNWINVGDTECDVAKIDAFNQVPIIIGLEPGTSYHDDVRQWCGQFTGTFQFRVSICTLPSFIPVDCDLAN
ncbi:MAG: hypothetical protein ABI867_14105 [Kofleriaceae bacterium]